MWLACTMIAHVGSKFSSFAKCGYIQIEYLSPYPEKRFVRKNQSPSLPTTIKGTK